MIDNVKTWVIVGLAVALVGLGLWHFTHIATLKLKIANRDTTIQEQSGQIKGLQADLAMAERVNKDLASSVEKQNISIDGWLKAIQAQKVESDRALARVSAEREAWKSKYQGIWLSGPVDSKDEGASLSLTIDRYLDARRQE